MSVIDCRGFNFPKFEFGRSFTKNCDFSYGMFSHPTDFSLHSLLGEITELGVPKSDEQTDSYGIVFYGTADFSQVTFKGLVDFSFVMFRNRTSFFKARFDGTVSFMDTHFDRAVFNKATFQQAIFDGAVFSKKASFDHAEFIATSFLQTTFSQNAQFYGTKFHQHVEFSRCDFEEVKFLQTKFNQGVGFRGTRFNAKTDFTQSSFALNTYFSGATVIDNPDELDVSKYEFVALDIHKDADVVFERMNLSKASFRDTNMELITFRDVVWNQSPSSILSPFRRQCLWDEFEPLSESTDPDYAKIAENYRQLVINYEQKRDYDSAEDFHIGEMEMRRKTKGGVFLLWNWNNKNILEYPSLRRFKSLREWFNAYAVYRLISNYGTSYWQAVLVLIGLLLIFSAAFLFAGFRPTKETNAQQNIIEYNVLPDETHHPTNRWISDYRESVLFSLSIVTFQRDRFYEPVGWQSTLCLNLAVVILTLQSAMVLLAIRRRFRR